MGPFNLFVWVLGSPRKKKKNETWKKKAEVFFNEQSNGENARSS